MHLRVSKEACRADTDLPYLVPVLCYSLGRVCLRCPDERPRDNFVNTSLMHDLPHWVNCVSRQARRCSLMGAIVIVDAQLLSLPRQVMLLIDPPAFDVKHGQPCHCHR